MASRHQGKYSSKNHFKNKYLNLLEFLYIFNPFLYHKKSLKILKNSQKIIINI